MSEPNVVRPSLAGRRVVVTRAADQSDELVERLTALGAQTVVIPLIEIVEPVDGGQELRAALGQLARYDWLAVTSANGARRVGPGILALGADRPRLAAVGTATAAVMRSESGFEVDLIPSRQTAEALVELFPDGDGAGRVLIAQAESASAVLADGLAAKGWQVDVVVAYRTQSVRPSPGQLLGALAADAVLFASGSAVRSWMQVFGSSTPPIVIAIGPSTAAIADEIGLKVDAVAADHSLSGLVTCLLTHLGDSD